MTFIVALEDEGFTRTRVDHTPYIQAIQHGDANREKVVAISLPADEADTTVGILRSEASKLGVGLRFDHNSTNQDGTVKIRFRVTAKRKASPEAAAKRKATMEKNGTTAGRKPKTTNAKK